MRISLLWTNQLPQCSRRNYSRNSALRIRKIISEHESTRYSDTINYWFKILDVFGRKIVGNEVHETESAELVPLLMRRASLAEGLAGRPLALHSGNGSAMKSATMLATLENLGVATSFNRPRVSS